MFLGFFAEFVDGVADGEVLGVVDVHGLDFAHLADEGLGAQAAVVLEERVLGENVSDGGFGEDVGQVLRAGEVVGVEIDGLAVLPEEGLDVFGTEGAVVFAGGDLGDAFVDGGDLGEGGGGVGVDVDVGVDLLHKGADDVVGVLVVAVEFGGTFEEFDAGEDVGFDSLVGAVDIDFVDEFGGKAGVLDERHEGSSVKEGFDVLLRDSFASQFDGDERYYFHNLTA